MLKFIKFISIALILFLILAIIFSSMFIKRSNKTALNIENILNLLKSISHYNNYSKPNFDKYSTNVKKTYTFSKKIKDIKVDNTFFDIILKNSSDNKIKVILDITLSSFSKKSIENLKNSIKFDVNLVSETLYISSRLKLTDESIYTKFSGGIKIYLPENFFLNNLSIINKSGQISIDSNYSKINKILINVKSGDILIGSLNSAYTEINITSGDLKINELNSDNLVISCISGDVDISDISSRKININLSSGNLTINSLKYIISTYVKVNSGDIFIKDNSLYENSKKNFVIICSSGNVKLLIPEIIKNRTSFFIKTYNGSISKNILKNLIYKGNNIYISKQYNTKSKIKIETNSGDIKILFY